MDIEQKKDGGQEVQVKKSRDKKWVWGVLAILFIAGSFRFGYASGAKGFVFEPKEFKIINQKDQVGEVDYSLLWQTVEELNKHYLEGPVSPKETLYGAVKGAVSASGDPYTEFFSPEDLKDFQTDLKGKFDGIGAEIGKKNGNIVVVSPLDESPAEKAGLRPKDIIVKVNDELVNDWSVEQTVRKIRGEKGTAVKLTIYREGDSEPFDVSIIRQTIEIKSVKWEVKMHKTQDGAEKKVGIITLSRFGEDTSRLFADSVRDLKKQNVSGIVLDLRNNPGGFLDTSVDLASYWLSRGTLVVNESKGDGTQIPFVSSGIEALKDTKTVVLINGGSASASEILAGALHDHGKAKLVGEKSFGKGSVQELVDLPGGSALKVTIAKWITPGGRNLNKDGLEPDEKIEMSDEDYKNERDPQMEKALNMF